LSSRTGSIWGAIVACRPGAAPTLRQSRCGFLAQRRPYCERTDPGFWSEPLNAFNGSFSDFPALLALGGLAVGSGRGETGYRLSGGWRAEVRISAGW
jgi:hypothetical protein